MFFCVALNRYRFLSVKLGGTVPVTLSAGGAIRVEDLANAASTNNVYYILKDHLGSASVTLNSSGTAVAEMRFYPFGETRVTSGAMPTDQRFQGQREVSGLGGLMQFGARFYLPKLGRFASADTIVPSFANPQAFNRYTFVLNNPLRYIDPTGHDPIPDQGLGNDPTCSNVTCISGDAVLDDGLSMGGGLGNCGCTGTATTAGAGSGGASGGGTALGGGGDYCSRYPVECQFETRGSVGDDVGGGDGSGETHKGCGGVSCKLAQDQPDVGKKDLCDKFGELCYYGGWLNPLNPNYYGTISIGIPFTAKLGGGIVAKPRFVFARDGSSWGLLVDYQVSAGLSGMAAAGLEVGGSKGSVLDQLGLSFGGNLAGCMVVCFGPSVAGEDGQINSISWLTPLSLGAGGDVSFSASVTDYLIYAEGSQWTVKWSVPWVQEPSYRGPCPTC
jgi:RHS repeat-associated protein